MYAIILSGGKQYKVAEGDVIEVEKLYASAGEKVELEVLLTVNGDKVLSGTEIKSPVKGEVLGNVKGKKVVVYKYKPKKNVRRKKGHRQQYTRVKIGKIS